MKIFVNNDNIEILDPTRAVEDNLVKLLSYTDSAKQYSLRRMAKNPFLKKQAAYKKLEKEIHGCLVNKTDSGSIIIPSGFYHLVADLDNIIDKRTETGKNISLPWKNKPFTMRDYQDEGNDLMCANWRGLLNFATGLGKTLTAIYTIRNTKKRTLVLCPGVSIADNFYDELVAAFGEHKVGYFGDGKKQIKDITVGIATSVKNHIEKFKAHDLGLMIVDEVHHIPATTFYTIAEELGHIGKIFGLTATDFRTDGKDVMITAGVGDVLIKRDLIWGIENKWLREPYFMVRNVPTTGRDYRGDKNKNYKAHVLNSPEMNEQIIADIKKFMAAGMSVLCLVDEIAHGQMIADAVGLPFASGVDKKTKIYISELNTEKIPGLIGTSKFIGEGVDTKNVDVLVMAHFPASKGILWQSLGRGLRLYKNNNKLIVLDYIPTGSNMMVRHAKLRLQMYKEITKNVKVM